MNRKQLQLEVCKALLDVNSRITASELNENEIAVTTTGYDAVVFDKNEIIFDVSKIRKFEVLKYELADHDEDECVKPTGEMFDEHGLIIKKLKGESIELYVNNNYLKKFNGYQFFAKSSTERILAKDEFGRLVGCFLPVRKGVAE